MNEKMRTPKRVTREEIAEQLKKNQSAEFEEWGVVYYYWIDDAPAFTSTITPADYGITPEEYAALDEHEDPVLGTEYFYDRETLDDPAFAKAVDEITEQVNAYLAELDDED